MEANDSDITVTSWKETDNNAYVRTIEYSHPVNAPLAPPMARARKEQRYRRYGDVGLSIETDTYVEDVPMADCFYVTDRVLLEPNADGAVVILAEFDMRFVRSTMFRSLISNTTRSEFTKWFQGLEVYWSEAMVDLLPAESPEEKEARRRSSIRRVSVLGPVETVEGPPTKIPAAVIPVSVTSRTIMLMLVLVLTMQSWIMIEMMYMKKAINEMESRIVPKTCPTLDAIEAVTGIS